MIVCICNYVTESEIQFLKKEGWSKEDIQDEYLIAKCCEKCLEEFDKVFEHEAERY